MKRFKEIIWHQIGMRGVADHVRELIQRGECHTALDIGCGYSSALSPFRPQLRTVGLDAHEGALNEARSRDQHDQYLLADIANLSPEAILKECGGERFDLVTLVDLIEHLPKRQGFELLDKCENLSRKYILVNTPNGFLEQGPELGNPYQRHLSGWFPHDFEGLAYKVHGSFGTRILRGYAGRPKYNFPGAHQCDFLLGWLLRAEKHPRWAFSLIAIKDVRGVQTRLNS